jgi:hypothetical protein
MLAFQKNWPCLIWSSITLDMDFKLSMGEIKSY